MSILEQLVSRIEIPKMVKLKQSFPRNIIEDIPGAVKEQLERDEIADRIKKGDRVALTVGSRGVANIPEIMREIANVIKAMGAYPFIIPAMGSHGGATSEGQEDVLTQLGVTEESIGVPIRATMDVVQVGITKSGLPVYIDKYAQTEADAIVIVGRIKPHTSFRGRIESGLAKMAVIGLGKQKGAEACHSVRLKDMPERIEEIAEVALAKSKIIFGVGIIENAFDETSKIVAIPAERILQEEPALLEEAKGNMPRIMFDKCDVLIVDEMGKNIAGTGIDPGIVRRHYDDAISYDPLLQRLVVLDLTRETHGNANGMGIADICTKRFFEKIDFNMTYPNPLTSRVVPAARMPMVMESDSQAIRAAIKTCFNIDYEKVRIIRIKNTLKLEEIWVSENMLDEAKSTPGLKVVGEPECIKFDAQGNMIF